MFGNLGMGELIIIAGIALVVIGPEKFPEFAKIALRAYRDLRGYVEDIKHEMAEEMKPVKSELRQLSKFNAEDYIENLAKAVSAIDEPEKVKEVESAPSDAPQGESSPYENASAESSVNPTEAPVHTPETPPASGEVAPTPAEPHP
jgi:Tat protein translocase TatB subunit